jgi:DNA-nicking Smr family endonuclease
MSKKRTKKKEHAGDFHNRPFKTLKGVDAANIQQGPVHRERMQEIRIEKDPQELFRRSVQGARPLRRTDSQAAPGETSAHDVLEQEQQAPDSSLFLDAMRTLGAESLSAAEGDEDDWDPGRRSLPSRMRRLRKGILRIGRELDLHGFARGDALHRLEQFIVGAAAEDHEAVLVITGKGINSPGGPILQSAVDSWLRGPGSKFVAEFSSAPRDLGGTGAFVVFFRRRP